MRPTVEATLRWCGRDVDRHPALLADYVSNTSPRQLMDHGDDAIDAVVIEVVIT